MKKLFQFVLAFAALGAVVSCGSSASSPGDAAKQYAGYIADGEYDKFVDALYFAPDTSAEDVKEGKEMMRALLEEKAAKSFEEKGGLKSTEVLSETISEDGLSAEVKLRYTYGNGTTSDEEMKLRLHEGKWLAEMGK
ncbi:MAG: DUF4878 domain-containing protein [Alistipes sp.]|jgi:hypothetical protein|nr:DUF4878 domain-containing protein [Alistipes sp.]